MRNAFAAALAAFGIAAASASAGAQTIEFVAGQLEIGRAHV